MKKLSVPAYDLRMVRRLKVRLLDAAVAQKLWQSNSGRYKRFKSDATRLLKLEQSNRCAYCGTRLHEDKPHRDHIAPKTLHFRWTFWPANLVLACYCCNVDCKGDVDTVTSLARSYRRTTFSIIHPFFDNPSDHLASEVAERGILFRPKNSSAKGAETIRLFRLMSPERAKERAKDVLLDDDVEHLFGITRSSYLAAVSELQGRRLVLKK